MPVFSRQCLLYLVYNIRLMELEHIGEPMLFCLFYFLVKDNIQIETSITNLPNSSCRILITHNKSFLPWNFLIKIHKQYQIFSSA